MIRGQLFIILIVCSTAALGQETLESKWVCATSYNQQPAYLHCSDQRGIILNEYLFKYSGNQCMIGEMDYNDELEEINIDNELFLKFPLVKRSRSRVQLVSKMNKDCLAKKPSYQNLDHVCNGHPTCFVSLNRETHRKGVSSNCDFDSNLAQIRYSCIPLDRMGGKNFDICEDDGPEVLLDVQSGFIHSPDYPKYYGNSRSCALTIQVPVNKHLSIYLINMSLEKRSVFSSAIKDYLKVDEKIFHGHSIIPARIFNQSGYANVRLEFVSDWITSSALASPKGFLLYFELNNNSVIVPTGEEDEQVLDTDFKVDVVKRVKQDNQTSIQDAQTARHRANFALVQEKKTTHLTTYLLVGLIGSLLLIIFALLLVRHRKQESIYYDNNKAVTSSSSLGGKSCATSSSGIGTESSSTNNYQSSQVYNPYEYTEGSGDHITVVQGSEIPSQHHQDSSKFGQKLRRLHSNLSKTINISRLILTRSESSVTNKPADLVDPSTAKKLDAESATSSQVDTKTPQIDRCSQLDDTERNENPYVTNPTEEETQSPSVDEQALGKRDSLPVYESVANNTNSTNVSPVTLNISNLYSTVINPQDNFKYVDQSEVYQTISELDLDPALLNK